MSKAEMTGTFSQTRFTSDKPDSSGVLKNVSVMTIGQANDHHVDAETLTSVVAAGNKSSGGVRMHLDHSHGMERIVGAARNFRIEGTQVRADAHLLKSHPAFHLLSEMARSQPETFGLSISFLFWVERDYVNRECVRITELYGVDFVGIPAANPAGLFSAQPTPPPPVVTGFNRVVAAFKVESERKHLADVPAPLKQPQELWGLDRVQAAFARERLEKLK